MRQFGIGEARSLDCALGMTVLGDRSIGDWQVIGFAHGVEFAHVRDPGFAARIQ
jgi:hypothetical protein